MARLFTEVTKHVHVESITRELTKRKHSLRGYVKRLVRATPADLCDEVAVSNDAAYEEPEVGDLDAGVHLLRFAQVEMHAVVGNRNEFEVEVFHAIDFELESQRWLQVPVDTVLLELRGREGVREGGREAGREGGRERGSEGGREGGREGERE